MAQALDRRAYSKEPPVVGTRLYSGGEPVPRLTPTAAIFRRRSKPSVRPLAPERAQINIVGLVDRKEPYKMDELMSFRPQHRSEAMHICAGDGRLVMEAEGTQWVRGDSMSAFEVAGVPLGAILADAGVQQGARYVSVVSGDGFVNRYEYADATNPRILVVTEMNGEQLLPELGGPVRIVSRGDYGVRSPGNIETIVVSSKPPHTRVNDDEYRYRYRTDGGEERGIPVGEIRVISHAVNVQPGDTISPDAEIVVRAGVGSTHRRPRIVEGVVFSIDGGETWQELDKIDDPRENVWSLGVIDASRLPHGPVSLVTKARDSWGMEQPERARWNRGGYGNNGWNHPLEFEVAA